MLIFKLFAPDTVRLLSGHILPRSESNFTHSHLDFKTFSLGETPGPLLTGAENEREGMGRDYRVLPLKEVQRARTGEGDRDGRGKGG